MPAITNQQMRKALSIVIELALEHVLATDPDDPRLTEKRKEQLNAIALVEHLQTTLFMHNLTRGKDDVRSTQND